MIAYAVTPETRTLIAKLADILSTAKFDDEKETQESNDLTKQADEWLRGIRIEYDGSTSKLIEIGNYIPKEESNDLREVTMRRFDSVIQDVERLMDQLNRFRFLGAYQSGFLDGYDAALHPEPDDDEPFGWNSPKPTPSSDKDA